MPSNSPPIPPPIKNRTTAEYLHLNEAVQRVSREFGELEAERFLNQLGRDEMSEGSIYGQVNILTPQQALTQIIRLITAGKTLNSTQWVLLCELALDAYNKTLCDPVRGRFVHGQLKLFCESVLKYGRDVSIPRALYLADQMLSGLITLFEVQNESRVKAFVSYRAERSKAVALNLCLTGIREIAEKVPDWIPTDIALFVARVNVEIAKKLTDAQTFSLSKLNNQYLSELGRVATRGLSLHFGCPLDLTEPREKYTGAVPFSSPHFSFSLYDEQDGFSSEVYSMEKSDGERGFDMAYKALLECEKNRNFVSIYKTEFARKKENTKHQQQEVDSDGSGEVEALSEREPLFIYRLSPKVTVTLSLSQAEEVSELFNKWRKDPTNLAAYRRASKLHGEL